eukprot:gb/GEZN01010775.1/.p1 GENE.gb/GEZN01010775.1/~~gb/GEZN01010775.1/.p1  ORF type:complete len:170 (-),score=9.63 gb/GEZN01010775.1/:387-896(-)
MRLALQQSRRIASRATGMPSLAVLGASSRSLHSTGRRSNWKDSLTSLPTDPSQLVQKWKHMTDHERFRLSVQGLIVLFPVSVFLSPLPLINIPLDLVLGAVVPFHMAKGMIKIVEDYCPNRLKPAGIMGMIAVSIFTAYGLLKVNICGKGITETIKSLWREPPKPSKKK